MEATHQTYLPTIFYIWKFVTSSLYHDMCAIKLVSDLALDSIESKLIKMSKYGMFTKEQLSFMFTNFLRVLEISVSQGGSPYVYSEQDSASRKQSEKSKAVYDISKIIVFSISGNESLEPDGILEHLENLINSIETFFHPSNNGPWSHSITVLIEFLTQHMVFRWNSEHNDEFLIPKERRITDQVKDRFVSALRGVALMSIHSKSNSSVQSALNCLQGLAYLSPNLVLPFVLKEVYPSLQGVVETHRTLSSLKALSFLTRIITQTPRYAIHLTTLLSLAIPGIDANDLNKTFQALSFIQAAALNAPFWDLSGDIGGGLAMEYISNDVAYLEELVPGPSKVSIPDEKQKESFVEDEFRQTVTSLPELGPELLEQVWKSSTYLFREFIIDFLERIFTLIENLPDPSSNKQRASQESNVIMLLSPTFSAIMASLPGDLYETVLSRFLDFISNNVYYSATDAIALICSTIVRDNPQGVFPRIFPMLKANIETEILENGAGSVRSGSEILPRDRTLIWYLSILNMSLSNAYEEVLNFKKEILELTIFLRDHTKGSIVFHVSNAVHHALISLSLTMIKDYGIIPDRFNKVAGKDVTLKNWGEKINSRELKFEWYTISREGIEYAYELYKVHVEKSLANIRAVISSESKSTASITEISDILSSNLTYIRTATSGIALLLDPHFRDYYKDDFSFNESGNPNSLVMLFNKEESSGEDDAVDVDGDAEDDDDEMFSFEIYSDTMSDEEDDFPVTERSAEDDGEADFSDEGLDFKKLREYSTGYFFENNRSDPLYINIHKLHIKVAHALHEIHTYMVADRENDIASFKALLFAYKVWFSDVGLERTAKLGESFTSVYNFESGKYRMDGLHKDFPRSILAKRATLYHYSRIYHNCGPKKITDLDKVLINDVLITSVSIYPNICRTAQSSLESAVKGLLKSRTHIVNWIVSDILKSMEKNELQRAESGMRVLALRILQSHIKKSFFNSTQFLKILTNALKTDKSVLNDLSHFLLETFAQSVSVPVTINLLNYDALQTLKPEKDVSAEIKKRRVRHEAKYKAIIAKIPEVEDALLKQLDETHWKILLYSLRFVISYASIVETKFQFHPDIPIKILKLCFNSHPHVSQFAGACMQCIFNRTFLLAANDYDFKKLASFDIGPNKYWVPSNEPNFTETFMKEMSNTENPHYYVDGAKPGWLVWGSRIAVTRLDTSDSINFSKEDNEFMSQVGAHIDAAWIEQLVVRSSEEKTAQDESVQQHVMYFLVNILRLLEMGYTKVTLEEVFKCLDDKFDSTDKNSHRCMAEFLCSFALSLSFSSKESRILKEEYIFNKLKDIIENHLFRDVLRHWRNFISTSFSNIDHRRLKTVVDYIFSFRLDRNSTSVFKETSRTMLFQELNSYIGWSSPVDPEIVDHYWAHIDYPKKDVCIRVGQGIAEFFFDQFHESCPSVELFIKEQLEYKDGLGGSAYLLNSKYESYIKDGFAKLEHLRLERKNNASTLSESGSDAYIHTAYTLSHFLIQAVSWSCGVGLIPILPTVIIPSMLQLFTLSEDPDLGRNAVSVFRRMGNMYCPHSQLQFLIDSIVQVLRSAEHWHQRLAILAFIQTFFFRQLFQLSHKQRQQFIQAAADTLTDSQLEVRESAAETLSGMIRCSPSDEQAALIKKLYTQFKQSLQKNKPIRRALPPRNAEERRLISGTSTPNSEAQSISIKRHAAVLGLGSLVTAFPYKSPPPKWIPQVLTTLATVASEPGMTGKSVKTLLGSFKNTRTDTWHIDSKAFTSEQLEDLEGVLWRSYFV